MDNSLRGPSKIRKRAAKACLACRARKVGTRDLRSSQQTLTISQGPMRCLTTGQAVYELLPGQRDMRCHQQSNQAVCAPSVTQGNLADQGTHAVESRKMTAAMSAPQGQVSSLPLTRSGAARGSRRQLWNRCERRTCPPAPRQTLGVKTSMVAQFPLMSLPRGPWQEATARGRLFTTRTPTHNGSRFNMLQCQRHLCSTIRLLAQGFSGAENRARGSAPTSPTPTILLSS